MTQIKVGDNVTAHLNSDITGTVVEVTREDSAGWSSAGPISYEPYCVVKLKNEKLVRVKMSDLYIVY